MAEKCASSNSQPVGCQRIQKMDAAIRRLQRKRRLFSPEGVTTGICLLALLVGGLFVFRTFRPISYPTEIRLDVRVDGGGAVSEKTKANVKLELSEALLAMEARAAAAYNEKFATLLTILTIFGIAWPLIIGLLQYKMNESEMEKIRLALQQAENANAIAYNLRTSVENLKRQVYCEIAEEAYHNAIFWEADMEHGKTERAKDNGKRCHVKALIKSIYYYALAGKLGRANSKAKTAMIQLNEMKDWPKNKQSFVINEIDWDLFVKLV